MNAISQLPTSPPISSAVPSIANEGGDFASFKDLLAESIQQVNSLQLDSNQAVDAPPTGGEDGTAEVLTVVQKADLAFRLTMQLHDKLLDVYREIQEIRI